MEKLTLHRAPTGQPVERVVLDGGDPLWYDEADVVVAGCGSGGAPAAIEAARAGADVFVFEKADGAGVRACLAVGVSPAFMEEGNSGGLRIDGRARAQRADGRPVSGLYITTRAVGGLFSESRNPQGDSFISTCLCFGRIAGREAAARERRRAIPYG